MDSNNASDESICSINETVEHLQKLVKLRASSNTYAYTQCTKNLLQLVSSQEKAMKHFVSASVGGIQLLVTILEHTQDQHVKQMAVLMMKEMLRRKSVRTERAQILANSGAINPLLKLVVKSHQPFSFTDDFVSCLYSVTAKIGKRDKKFAMKARLLGVLPVIITHIRYYALRSKVLNSVLMLLKRVLASAVNATQLSKADLIPHLLTFLDTPRRKITLSVMYSLEAISLVTRSRYAARQFVQKEVTEHLLQVLFNVNHSPGTNRIRMSRMVRAFSAVLHTLLHITQIRSGREALCAAGAVNVLLNWCRSIVSVPGSHCDRMVMKASTIIQRCLPPRPLPVSRYNGLVVFNLPDHKFDEQFEYAESKNGVSDSDSQISSNSSSFESDGESDQESNPYPETSGFTSGDSARQFRSFFEELREDREPKLVQETIKLQEPLVFLSYEPRPSSESMPTSTSKGASINSKSQWTNGNGHSVASGPSKHQVTSRDQSDATWPDRASSSSGNKQQQASPMPPPPINCDSCKKLESSPSKLISCINISEQKPDKISAFTMKEVRDLMDSAKEEKRSKEFLDSVDTTELYHSFASRTVSVLPFVKTAYPDTKCLAKCEEPLVKLYSAPAGLMRKHAVKHMADMVNKDAVIKEIYSLDSLMCESAYHNTSLTNHDEKRILSDVIPEHLTFESRFESGNLRKAFWRGGREYDLILNPDVNSKGHHQWFYFEVFGMEAGFPYVFNVINMEKSTSLFNDGMCPVMFSVKSFKQDRKGWMRAGSEICYFRNHYILGASTMSSLRDKPYYTLTFTVTFPYDNDVCYLAYHYPYTYSALQTQIDCWMSSYDTTSVYCKRDELCKTLAGNSVPLLTITAKPVDGSRQYIILTARVHPGESNSSWAMKGTLDFLFSSKPSAHRLRESFIFKVVPMLNADGVINGCHRCSLSGQDLNRQWVTPNVKLHPTIYYTKALFYYLNSLGRKPLVYCDYHGHSRRHNVFLYGCNPEQSWWSNDEGKIDSESFKVIPLLMHHMVPTFSIDHCCFNIERSRESTARVTIWRQFDAPLSYTMECTYGGCDQGLYAGYHIGISQLEETGMKLCQCFGKITPGIDKHSVITCTIPIDTSLLCKAKPGKSHDTEHADSFSSSLSEDDPLDYEDSDQMK